jgi:hypothetical protein
VRFPRKRYSSSAEKSDDFLIGALVWGLANIALGVIAAALTTALPGVTPQLYGALALLGNILYFLYFGQTRPWFAFGAVGCLGALLLIAFALYAFVATVCGSRLTPA